MTLLVSLPNGLDTRFFTEGYISHYFGKKLASWFMGCYIVKQYHDLTAFHKYMVQGFLCFTVYTNIYFKYFLKDAPTTSNTLILTT